MRPINAVLAHHDAPAAQRLGDSLRKEFRNLVITQSAGELKSAVARYRAPFAVIDLELVGPGELKGLVLQGNLFGPPREVKTDYWKQAEPPTETAP